MNKPCKSDESMCCARAAYWREMSYADAARNELLASENGTLHTIVKRLRKALRERDAQIEELINRSKPLASEYGLRQVTPVRRRA